MGEMVDTTNGKCQNDEEFSRKQILLAIALGLILGIGLVYCDTNEETGKNFMIDKINHLQFKMDVLKELNRTTWIIEKIVLDGVTMKDKLNCLQLPETNSR